MKKLYYALLGALLALMLGVGVWSLFGNGETVSGVDGKQLAQRPEFSFAALFDGSYLPALEAYYTDHFPMRDTLLTAGKTLNKFYYYSGSEENTMLIVSGSTGAETMSRPRRSRRPAASSPRSRRRIRLPSWTSLRRRMPAGPET